MKGFEIGVILTVCLLHAVAATTFPSCRAGGSMSMRKTCYQPCELGECKCNTTNTIHNACNQICFPPNCIGNDVTLTCSAEQNCTQTCATGLCDMTCDAEQFCEQRADNNGLRTMSCSSKRCSQSCMHGGCNMMYCDSEYCLQTCGKGGCIMNCTESVKMCSQRCTSNEKCILECRAEVCLQHCDGPKQCIIMNAGSSLVYLNLPLFVIGFVFLLFTPYHSCM